MMCEFSKTDVKCLHFYSVFKRQKCCVLCIKKLECDLCCLQIYADFC